MTISGEVNVTPTLYTRQGPLLLRLSSVCCQECHAEADLRPVLQMHNIFLFSKESAFGDEIFLDFINKQFRSKLTFQGFCDFYTLTYRSTFPKCRPFVTRTTFKRAKFAWMSCLKIDFRLRENTCSVCRDDLVAVVTDGVQMTPPNVEIDYSQGVTKPDLVSEPAKPVVPG